MFPNGTEAWSEFRRTGYPRLFPVRYNYPSSGVDTNKQIRRMVLQQRRGRAGGRQTARRS